MEPTNKNPALAAGLSFFKDELGAAITIEIDTGLFEKAAIFKSAYWATERSYLFLTQDKDAGKLKAELRAKSDNIELEQLAREFCNVLIDQQTRQYVLRETSAERDILLAKAFGAGRTHLDPAAITDEHR